MSKKSIRLLLIAGARPNFMKIAPIMKAFEEYENFELTLVHTGQHYDPNLSSVFFEELGIRQPDVYLNVGSGSHARQTADVMVAIESLCLERQQSGAPFDGVMVVGDVNSTLAAAVAGAKLNIPVIHVEAGLRSRDRTMPEEINRILTDSISSLLLASEPKGVENLLAEGHSNESVKLVGNVMIDTLRNQIGRAKKQQTLSRFGLNPGSYGVVTLHRPANVDSKTTLTDLLDVIKNVSNRVPFIFPMHPRTRSRVEQFGLETYFKESSGCIVCEPLGYLDFLCLTSQARLIVTDSGGLQEESTALGIPCLTLRDNTERPITCDEGTGTLIGSSSRLLEEKLEQVLSGNYKVGTCPALWDGEAAGRIARVVSEFFVGKPTGSGSV